MKKLFTLILLLTTHIVWSQNTPFTASWSFEGSRSGVSTSSNVVASDASPVNVLVPSVGGFPSGQVGKAINVQNWSNANCAGDEYLEISVSPQNGALLTLFTLSFYYSRSAQGPNLIRVRSSVDNFGSDIFNGAITAQAVPYQSVSLSLSGLNSGFTNNAGSVAFRFYGCQRNQINGSMRLDEIVINAQALPVTLVSFGAKPQGEHVQLSWETAWERDADYFDVQRSANATEFITIGRIDAQGNSNLHRYYGFTDGHPVDGANYYRLRQVDTNGQIAYSTITVAVMDNLTPSLEMRGNPASREEIRVSVRNMHQATYRLTTLTGLELPLTLVDQSGGVLLLKPNQPLVPGVYLLWAEAGTKRLIQRIVVD